MTVAIIGAIGIVIAALAYLLDRRINRAVSWSAAQHREGHDIALVVTNTGISRARDVTVELDGSPKFRSADGRTPVDVDQGATVIVRYGLTVNSEPPGQVTVRWVRRLRRDGVWTTPI